MTASSPLVPQIPLTLDTELSYRSVMLVVFFSGMPGVINYYFQGKFKILLQAEGKEYIVTNMMTIIHLATNISKIILLLNGFDVVALQFMYLVFSLMQMIYIALYIKNPQNQAWFWGHNYIGCVLKLHCRIIEHALEDNGNGSADCSDCVMDHIIDLWLAKYAEKLDILDRQAEQCEHNSCGQNDTAM